MRFILPRRSPRIQPGSSNFLIPPCESGDGSQSVKETLRGANHQRDSENSAKAIWDFEGIYCTSRHIPHVKFAGLIHPGILGCAPSQQVLETWNAREAELIAANKLEDRNVAMPPEPQNVHAGKGNESEEIKQKVGREGARTIPGRPEHGGNCE